jgi:hypothetical protein
MFFTPGVLPLAGVGIDSGIELDAGTSELGAEMSVDY